MVGKMIIDFMANASMNEVWSMINALQLVVYTPLVPVKFPGNATMVFGEVIKIATFDVAPVGDWYPTWFSFPMDTDKPFNEAFDKLGFSSYYWVMILSCLYLGLAYLQLRLLL